jgi:HAD superfamily hydrolase (TIGR01509 family)
MGKYFLKNAKSYKRNEKDGMNMQYAVIFDMDGVLINSEPLYYEVEYNLYREFNLPVSRAEHESIIGMPMSKIWEIFKHKYGLEKSIEELVEIHFKRMLCLVESMETLNSIHGIPELIYELKKHNFKLAVATSTARKLALVMLKKIGILSDFDIIVCGDEVRIGKPAPDIFLKAASLLAVSPSHCLVFEDSSNGVLAAKSAKMKCIGYLNPDSGAQNLQKADTVIDDFKKINWKTILQLINT